MKNITSTEYDYEFKNIPTLQILNHDDLIELKIEADDIESIGFKLDILESHEEIKKLPQ